MRSVCCHPDIMQAWIRVLPALSIDSLPFFASIVEAESIQIIHRGHQIDKQNNRKKAEGKK
jgi:hypothetical protein